ncbi:MAG: single-stranded-DNA-specific exonuclease RecJ [Patescibacteria group bacterium]
MHDIHLKILKDRGLTQGEIEEFLHPEYREDKGGMYDVSKMKDIDKATGRIWKAIENGEKICVYADYDADGVPGATVLYEFFRKLKYEENVVVKIPHRHRDGFGLHSHIIDEAKEEGVTLLITIDLGISNVKEVVHANKLGIDVIITDHHLPHEEIPAAYAILNPKQADCKYVEKMLCGSGVIFKLVHRLAEQARTRGYKIHVGWEKWLLDLVGLATISDMVPLTGENRVFAHFGLKVLQKNTRLGFATLLSELKIDPKNLQEDDIGFSISPCINAASRMSHAYDAFMLLTSINGSDAGTRGKQLVSLNVARKSKAKTLVKDAEKKISKEDVESGILIFGDETWSPTLLGPVCSNMVRQFQLPAFAYACEDGDVFRGSCRSLPGVSVVEILTLMPEGFFIEFGGHAASGGFAFVKENETIFKEELQKAYIAWKVSDDLKNADVVKQHEIPAYTITHDTVDETLVHSLSQLKPFGMGNEKPYFCVTGVKLKNVKLFGKEKEHAEFIVESYVNTLGEAKDATPDFLHDVYKYSTSHRKVSPLRYISFFTDKRLMEIDTSKTVSLFGYVEESYFLGKREIRFRVEDITVN